MKQVRRNQYASRVESHTLSLFFSGKSLQKSGDQHFPFSVNRNFFYLSGIVQENVCLLIAKGKDNVESYLFLEETDPIKALWDGAGLTFEQAASISEIDVKNVRDIKTLDLFISQLLSTSRRALFGFIDTLYLDLERQSDQADDTIAIRYAKVLKEKYPFVQTKTNQMILAELRMIKDAREIEATKSAISITKQGLNRIMSSLKPGKNEYEIEAEFNYVLNLHRSSPAFGTILAGGKNATILHYVDNGMPLGASDLVLCDLGAISGQYNADITRTYPVSGKFTARQKAVYEVVLEANQKTIAWLKPGVTLKEFNDYGKQILIDGAKKLGLITTDEEISKYYYHSLGHYLGLDVHDVGNYSLVIPEGALITVEPGLYIAEENIGIRIEDDVIVTQAGAINLSQDIIKEVKDIEAFMKR
jgi:Xaa-Pro aminopeptidase